MPAGQREKSLRSRPALRYRRVDFGGRGDGFERDANLRFTRSRLKLGPEAPFRSPSLDVRRGTNTAHSRRWFVGPKMPVGG